MSHHEEQARLSWQNRQMVELERRLPRLRLTSGVMAGICVFVASILQEPMAFKWDAVNYWGGSTALAHLSNPYVAGQLSLRGVLTPLLYLPAAVVARAAGPDTAGFCVIVENSVLIALVGALLLPRLVGLWRPVTPLVVYVCAGLTWLLIGRFAPYPLTDLWAAALILTVVLIMARPGIGSIILGGALAGAALNIRPAYLLPVVFGFAVVVWFRRLPGLWFIVGIGLALLPQTLFNLIMGKGWYPAPQKIASQTRQQAYFGSFTVRHDTVAYIPRRTPQQFYCDPSMARALGNRAPHSTVGLVVAYLQHPLQASALVAEKLGAVLHWPISAPYHSPAPGPNDVFAFIVTTITVVGSLIVLRGIRKADLPKLFLLVIWLGAVWTLATGTPEIRYSLPLVLIGIVGLVVAGAGLMRPSRRWLVGGLIVLGVFGIGVAGLAHPAPQGLVTPAICAKT